MYAKIRTSRTSAGRHGVIRRSGLATLELALTLSILFSICYGTIEFGYYFFVKNTMQGAAREGCRAGIVAGAANTDVNNAAINQLVVAGLLPTGSTTSGNYTIVTSPSTVSSTSVGTTLTVTITATWGVVGANFRPMGLIGASKVLSAACSMRKEG